MDIYTPYTYLIGWSQQNIFYYGRRTARGCHPNDFWIKYFTSSKEVDQFRKEFGEPDIIQIRKVFPDNPEKCKLWESKVLSRIDAQHDPRFLNKKNGDHKWDTTGKVTVKNISGETLQITTEEFMVNKNYVGIGKGYTIAQNSIGEKFRVSIYDERLQTGELVGIAKNKVVVKDKNGNTFQVSTNDSRYVYGELTHMSTGTVPVVDSNGKCYSVTKEEFEDKRNNLISPTKGKVVVIDVDGNIKQISKSDPEYTNGTTKSIYKNKIPVKHKITGEYFQVNSNDPRYISGELITIYKWSKLHKK